MNNEVLSYSCMSIYYFFLLQFIKNVLFILALPFFVLITIGALFEIELQELMIKNSCQTIRIKEVIALEVA